MQQLTIRMPDEDLSRIEKIAKLAGLKKSDITRMAIKKFVEEYDNEKEESPYRKASHLIGIIESGKSNLGRNHRKYLINKIKRSR